MILRRLNKHASFVALTLYASTVLGQAPGNHDGKAAPKVETFDVAKLSGPQIIDQHLDTAWKKQGLEPSDREADTVWLRRAYLDILGRIPRLAEIQAFAAKPDRDAVCDQLVDRPEFGLHMGRQWANVLMPAEPGDRNRRNPFLRPGQPRIPQSPNDLAKAIGDRLRAKQGWDQIARELVQGSPDLIAYRNSVNGENQETLTERTSQVLLGTQVQCAKCHDQPDTSGGNKATHPSRPRLLKQEEYLALNAFFRTPVSTNGTVNNFTGVNREGDVFTTKAGFDGKTLNGMGNIVGKDGAMVDSGRNTGEQAIAKLITSHDTFSKAFVNRVWGNMFGRGLNAGDVDGFRADDNLNHPGLMEDLSKKFTQAQYKPQELVRWICKSRAYHLSSVSKQENLTFKDDKPIVKDQDNVFFARGPVKPMTAEQMADSFMVALGQNPDDQVQSDRFTETSNLGGRPIPRGGITMTRREAWLDTIGRAKVEDSPGKPADFKQTVINTLAMMNGTRMNEGVTNAPVLRAPGNLDQKITLAYLTTVSRRPTAAEMQKLKDALSRSPASMQRDTAGVTQDILWALMNSAEFILNH